MKAWDYDAVTYDGAVYCVGCLPDGVEVTDEDVMPIFADSESDYAPTCDACGCEHDYMNVMGEEEEEEETEEQEA